jgi:hypothetical protein
MGFVEVDDIAPAPAFNLANSRYERCDDDGIHFFFPLKDPAWRGVVLPPPNEPWYPPCAEMSTVTRFESQ